jgi:WD40 repeat protein
MSINIWNTEDGTLLKAFREHTNNIIDLIVLDNGFLASSSWDGTVKIWDLDESDSHLVHSISVEHGRLFYMTALPNARFVVSSTRSLHLIDTIEGEVLETFEFTSNPASDQLQGLVTFNSGKHIASCVRNINKIYVWKVDEFALVKTIENANCITYLTALNDGNLAAGGLDGLIRIYYTASDVFFN